MSLSDRKKRRDELKNEVKNNQNSSQTSTIGGTYSSSRSQKRAAMKQEIQQERLSAVSSELTSRIDTWFKNNENYINNYNSRFSGVTGSYTDPYDAGIKDWERTVKRQNLNFFAEAASIKSIIEENKDYLNPDWANEVLSAFDNALRVQRDIVNNSSERAKYFSNWDSEESYKRYQKISSIADMTSEQIKQYLSGDDPVAFTTDDGKEVTWDYLYKTKFYEELMSGEDFEEYSKLGASIKNPSYAAANGSDNFLGWKNPFAKGEEIGNIVTFSRDNIEDITKAMSGANNNADLADVIGDYRYQYMTDDEVAIYNYYLGKGDTEKAAEYLADLDEALNARWGEKIADRADSNIVSKLVFGLGAGLDQFVSGAQNIKNFITGGEAVATTPTQFASSIIREDLGTIGGVAYDLAQTTGNMLPSILVGGLAGSVAGTATMGVSAAGNGYNEMRKLGYDEWQARGYGLLVGASEATLQYALGGISKLGGKVTNNAISNLVSKFDNAIARVAIDLGGNMLSEGLEEAVQSVLEPAFKSLMTGEGYNVDWEEVFYSGLLGVLSAGLLEGVPTIAGTASNSNAANKIYGDNVQDLVTESLEIDPENAHAQRMQTRLDSDKNVSGYQLNRLAEANEIAMRENDIATMKKAAEDKLTARGERGDVKKLAEIIVKSEIGEKLTRAETNALEASDFGRSVRQEMSRKSLNSDQDMDRWAENLNTDRVNADVYGKMIAQTENENAAPKYVALTDEQKKAGDGLNYTPKTNIVSPPDEPEEKEAEETSETVSKVAQKPTVASEGSVEAREEKGATYETPNAKVKEISSVKDGKITVKLESGEVVDASEVDFGNEDTALVYRAAAEMSQGAGYNEDTVKVLVNGFESSGLNASEYLHAFRDSFNYGATGTVAISALENGKYTSLLSEKQRELAFHLGKAFGEESAQRAEQERARIEKEKTASAEKEAKAVETSGGVIFDGSVNQGNLSKAQNAQIKVLRSVSSALGAKIHLFASEATVTEDGRRTRAFSSADGEAITANGWYDNESGEIWIDINAGVDGNGLILFTAAHELTHFIKDWSSEKYNAFANFLISQYAEKGVSVDELIEAQIEKAAKRGREMTREEAFDEVVADSCESFLADSNAAEKIAALNEKDATLAEKIKSYIHKLLVKIRNLLKGIDPDSEEGKIVRGMTDSLEKLYELWTDALADAGRSYQAAGVAIDASTESVAPQFSERTWTASEYVTERNAAAKRLAESLGVSIKQATKYIDNVNSIAKAIANDRARLDYEASSFGSAFVSNVEYGGSFDFTTLCKKRRIYTGTFSEIQKRIGDNVLTPDDILEIRNMMIEGGIEATCGLCYVEGSRANMGKFAKKFIELYKRDNPDGWTPTMVDVNTPDGVEQMRINHPETYERYEYFWNHYGKLQDSDPALFASQQKPKLYEARKEYKGEILQHFDDVEAIAKKNLNGGIRMQSFSDFEIVHLIDTMQIIMDMANVGLAGQAYTKVPEFAEAFGNTGLKINLSLIAKGVDADGNLIFDDREGMPAETAFKLRDKYSSNVGTILVIFTDEQLKAAMADPRVDFIIPFHRSQWKKSQYGAMGLPKGTKDYTFMQNEKLIKPTYHEYHGRMVKDKASNYMPNEYWDFGKSGKENAEAYLEMCAENNKRPKFYKLLDFDGKGKYSLKKDGSTDGYWKLLIDFKMYDNDGVGVPQRAVTPDFSMNEAMTMLDEYKGGHQSYPIAHGVVDKFVEGYKEKRKVQYSERDFASQVDAVLSGADTNNSHLKLMDTPTLLQEAGLPYLPILMTAKHLKTITSMSTKGDANYHGLDVEIVKKLPEYISDPVMMADSLTREDSIVIITEAIDSEDRPVIAAILLNGDGRMDSKHIKANIMTSAYGKDNFQSFLDRIAENDAVIYWDEKKSRNLSVSLGLQLPNAITSLDSDTIIHQAKAFVNSKSKKMSERDPDAISSREVLANALEGAVQNDIEAERLAEYKSKIAKFDAEEQKLRQLRAEIKELSFTPGKRDNARLAELRAEAEKTANRINIYDKQLLRLEASKPLEGILQREKQKAYKKAKADAAEKMNDMRAVGVREKIKKIKAEIERELQRPTDRTYIPTPLGRAMIEVCSLIDTDTPLIKKDGTVNRAQEKREKTKERLSELAAEYENLKNNDDYMLVKEHDEQIDAYLKQLRNEFDDVSIKDMSLDQLREFHDILRSIIGTLRDARKVIGKNDAKSLYEYGNAIISEQKKIGENRGERSNFQKQRDKRLNLSLSPMRNIERMSGYNPDSALVEITRDFEEGVRKKNFWEMGARKSFDSLITGKNEKNYQDSIYKEFGKEYTDSKGRKFRVSKMQMMQAILSYEREISNAGKKHIEKGGLTFADLKLLEQGKIADAVSGEEAHNVPNAAYIVADFISALANDKWAQDYMAAAREFFNKTAKDAINDTYLRLKHRIIARDKNYIPYEVDKTQVVRDITNMDSLQQTINSYGILQDTQKNAPQALIITGLNNMVDRHIDQVGSVYGLAIPVRNFNKIWNIRESAVDGGEEKPITVVQGVIEENWGADGKKFIEQMVTDLQGARKNTRSELERKIESGYIGATFALNLSVVMKQIGSLYTANSELDRSRTGVGMLANLAYTMAHFDKLAAEVDKYTAAVYNRRQGLSDNEVHTFITQAKKSGISRALNKLPAGINPTKWITFMDASVALSLWKYVKADVAKNTNLKGEELLKETAKRFDSLIENTQSMSDVLHKPEIQKRQDVFSKSFAMFKTDLYQSAGQLRVMAGRYQANKSDANKKALTRTVVSIARSAAWNSLMTTLFALLRYKVNPYRDDEEELTPESWLKRQGVMLAGDFAGYLFPIFGSEIVGLIENVIYGESEEAVDSLALTLVNDLVDSITTIGNAITEGEMPDASEWENLLMKSAQFLGIPLSNIKRTVKAIRLHAEDIANGEFLSFEAGANKTDAKQLYDAVISGNDKRIEKAEALFDDQKAIDSALRKGLRENDVRIKAAARMLNSGDIRGFADFIDTISGEGFFDGETVEAAIRAEASAFNSKIKDAAEAKRDGKTDDYIKIVKELRERYRGVYMQDEIVEAVNSYTFEDVVEDDVEEVESVYKNSDINAALESGDTETASEIIKELIEVKTENNFLKAQREAEESGKRFNEKEARTRAELDARSTIRSSLTSYWKKRYITAFESGNRVEVNRIRTLLHITGIYGKRLKELDDILETWLEE